MGKDGINGYSRNLRERSEWLHISNILVLRQFGSLTVVESCYRSNVRPHQKRIPQQVFMVQTYPLALFERSCHVVYGGRQSSPHCRKDCSSAVPALRSRHTGFAFIDHHTGLPSKAKNTTGDTAIYRLHCANPEMQMPTMHQ